MRMNQETEISALKAELKRQQHINHRFFSEIIEADSVAQEAVSSLEAAMQMLVVERHVN